MTQLPLPLAYRSADGERDFIVSAANADAVAWFDRWPGWPAPQVLLIGPEGAGKSHLARIFARRVPAHVIDDAAVADPETLFHAWNAATLDAPLVMLARTPPRGWPRQLADLASRLDATPRLVIAAPDDALLAALLAKRFRDQGVLVAPDVADFVLARIERSFAGVAAAGRRARCGGARGGARGDDPACADVLGSQADWIEAMHNPSGVIVTDSSIVAALDMSRMQIAPSRAPAPTITTKAGLQPRAVVAGVQRARLRRSDQPQPSAAPNGCASCRFRGTISTNSTWSASPVCADKSMKASKR